LRNVALLVVLVAGAAALTAFLLQGRILFQGARASEQRHQELRDAYPHVEEQSLIAADGVQLHGWLVKSTHRDPSPLVIYFGGNGEEVSWMADRASELAGWSLLLMSYRGYGLSEGRPTERKLLEDALAVYDRIARRQDIDGERIVAMGRSLGSGIAVYLASERIVSGTILITPYDSIAAVAHERFPFLPVRLLLRHRFEAASWAAEVCVPMLALLAAEDSVIPPRRSQGLVSAWGGPREVHLLEGVGHNSIDRHPAYWRSIERFLLELETP